MSILTEVFERRRELKLALFESRSAHLPHTLLSHDSTANLVTFVLIRDEIEELGVHLFYT